MNGDYFCGGNRGKERALDRRSDCCADTWAWYFVVEDSHLFISPSLRLFFNIFFNIFPAICLTSRRPSPLREVY